MGGIDGTDATTPGEAAMVKSPHAAGRPKIRTMEELSAAIGISRPTLSRFFHDPTSVRDTTRRRIQEELQRVDYTPNFFATRMNRKTTRLIGVVIPYLNDLFFTSLLEAIELAAEGTGFSIITQSSHGDRSREARAVEKLMSMSADGVLVAPLGTSSALEPLERLGANMPYVFIDSHLRPAMPDADFIGTDNRQSVGLIVDYLCRTGAPPVYLGMPKINANCVERKEAYCVAMAGAGHEPRTIPEGVSDFRWDLEAYGHDVMDAHFARGRYRGATILCANDRLAIGAIRAAHRHGLFQDGGGGRSPLRIAGHDDHPLSRYMTPALTTVAQDTRAIGSAAVRRVIERIDAAPRPGEAAVTDRFEATLRIRDSA